MKPLFLSDEQEALRQIKFNTEQIENGFPYQGYAARIIHILDMLSLRYNTDFSLEPMFLSTRNVKITWNEKLWDVCHLESIINQLKEGHNKVIKLFPDVEMSVYNRRA